VLSCGQQDGRQMYGLVLSEMNGNRVALPFLRVLGRAWGVDGICDWNYPLTALVLVNAKIL